MDHGTRCIEDTGMDADLTALDALELDMPALQARANNLFALATAWAERHDAICSCARLPEMHTPRSSDASARVNTRFWPGICLAKPTKNCAYRSRGKRMVSLRYLSRDFCV